MSQLSLNPRPNITSYHICMEDGGAIGEKITPVLNNFTQPLVVMVETFRNSGCTMMVTESMMKGCYDGDGMYK